MAPTPSPCPAPVTLEPEPSRGRLGCLHGTCHGDSLDSGSWRSPAPRGPAVAVTEGPSPAGRVVRRSWCPGPFGGSWVLQDRPSLPAIAHVLLPRRSPAPGLCRRDPGSKPPPDWTARLRLGLSAPGVALCGRRAGGKALTLQSLLSPSPVPPPRSLPPPARGLPATADQWAQTQGGGPF